MMTALQAYAAIGFFTVPVLLTVWALYIRACGMEAPEASH